MLRFLSTIALRDFSKGWYVTTNGIPFILLFLLLLFCLNDTHMEELALY